MILIRERDVLSLLSMSEAINAIEEVTKLQAVGDAIMIPRQRIYGRGSVMNVMIALSEKLGYAGLKSYISTPSRSGSSHIMILYDLKTGGVVAIIEADILSRIRTGAASALASKYMARRSSSRASVIGAGRIGWAHAMAMLSIFPGIEVVVYSRTAGKAEEMVRSLRELGIRARVVSSYEEACKADIISTTTDSREPFIKGEWVAEGAHVNLVGSNRIDRVEAEPSLFGRASMVVTDSKEQAKIESGDLLRAIEAGVINWDRVHELWEVVLGKLRRNSETEITVFKSHGISLWDLAVGKKIYENAVKKGVGVEIGATVDIDLFPRISL